MRLAVFIFAVCAIPASAATIYQCTDARGNKVFSQHPCGADSKKLDVAPTAPSGISSDEELYMYQASLRKVSRGMSARHARLAWGEPTKINRSNYTGTVKEQWVYRRGNTRTQYLYFENGVLTGWSDN